MLQEVKTDIRLLSLTEIKEAFVKKGDKAFRGQQVYEWLWRKSCVDFDLMSNLNVETRNWLKENFAIHAIKVEDKQVSNDGTIKSGFRLHDGHLVEGVLIPADERMTACVSSQVGCSLTCKFCATGKMDRERNLTPGEIYDQVVLIKSWAMQHFQKPLTNIVFMGMGEPLLNYANVLKGIEMITSPEGLGMAADRITVSTAGIAKMIRKLADDEVRFNLALSLHAANDIKRNQIMPINESNNLKAVGESLKYFHQKTKKRVTFEYIAFKDFNEGIQDAKELLAFCKQFPAKVNVIEYNPTGDGQFEKADSNKIDQFCAYLERNGVVAKVRRSRGKDIDAACGQLANKKHSEALVTE
ncbi:MAG: 23S rRNA (adenine(2503)-C(2))-methyltransferase RlmN [Bacteroidia bacterium]|nr:23S rRNA (adenine(2503)-C(2))-methyltransferase RlmN [Bacteroidia bacterium]MCF8426112.1 23S rRNA (adenine(2503)-C(2))-methyltransferase RlmN [Bacteroidia bacterium]MCF8446488.1 23S rRNA (adenine(2503)-C(2))-methyltransferase RlmN [Bacteroidia bacterium]